MDVNIQHFLSEYRIKMCYGKDKGLFVVQGRKYEPTNSQSTTSTTSMLSRHNLFPSCQVENIQKYSK